MKTEQKKAYSRPELVKHGNVETLTQGFKGFKGGKDEGCSYPIYST